MRKKIGRRLNKIFETACLEPDFEIRKRQTFSSRKKQKYPRDKDRSRYDADDDIDAVQAERDRSGRGDAIVR
jgi:hypothetical protein